jgi:hypothetical protein
MIGTRIGFLFIVREAEWDFRCAKMTRWGGFVGMETAVAPTQNQHHQIHRSRFWYVCDVGGGETAVLPSHYPSILTLAAQTR